MITGEQLPKSRMIRFVTGPEGQVVPDILGKLPGRGYYVSALRTVLEKAVEGKVFSKGAKQSVSVPVDLIGNTEKLLADRVVALISMARKAGVAIAGFEKVKTSLADNKVKVLLQASDGSERGKTKLWTPEGARYFGCLTAQELGLAFGRGHVIHGALLTGGLSTRVIEDASKLRGLRENVAARKDDRS